jgi:hypothetical protein
MTKEFAEAKLTAFHEAFHGAMIMTGKTKEEADACFAFDPDIEAALKKEEALPLTKDNYGMYLGLVGKDAVKAVLLWKCGGNPIGIMTALYMNHQIDIP